MSSQNDKKYKPIEHAQAILGEHMTAYVILTVSPDAPNTLQMRTDNRYAAYGMTTRGLEILSENIVDDGWEIVWDVKEEDEEE